MHAPLDDPLAAIHVRTDDFLQPRCGPGRPPQISDAELIAPAIARVFLGLPDDRQSTAGSWRWRATGSPTCFPTCPDSPPTASGCASRGPARARAPRGADAAGAMGAGRRPLALAAGLFHDAMIGRPGRSFAAYGD